MIETPHIDRQRRLRRQTPLRRTYASSVLSMPQLRVPKTARRRRWRNRNPLRVPTSAIKRVVLSSRWVSLFLLALSVLSLVLVAMHEGYYLTMIPVEGSSSIPPAEIVEASGIAGAHIFAVSPKTAADRIASMPGVISATVTLEWPNQAYIRVREDKPIAVWQQGDEQFWITDEGDLVPSRADAPGLLHIIAEGEALPATTPGRGGGERDAAEDDAEVEAEAPEAPEAAVLFVPEDVLAGALQLRDLRPNIASLYYAPAGGLSYEDGRGWRVYFGTGTDMAQKLAVYETLVDHLLEQEVAPAYISVSDQQKPFYRPQGW